MRSIVHLTTAGLAKIQRQLEQSRNQNTIPLDKAISNLIEVVSPQINNRIAELADEPWYFAIGVAGTTYPTSGDEHETSDYDEICFAYNEADFEIEGAVLPAYKKETL